MIEIAPYKAEHGLSIICDQTRGIESWFSDCPAAEALMKEKENGYAWTLVEDDVPLVCGGFYRYAGTVAEAWYLMSPKGLKHLRGIMRIVRNIISTFISETGFTLIAHVLEEDAGGHAWAKYMGFKRTDIIIPDGGHMYVMYTRGVE